MTLPARLALLILIILLAGAGAAPAFAGEYTVYACKPASGYTTHGWTPISTAVGLTAYANCVPPLGSPPWNQGLVTRNGVSGNPKDKVPVGAYSAWLFAAPPGASLSRIRYDHEFCGFGGFRAGLMNAAGQWLHAVGPLECGSPVPDDYTLPLGGTSGIYLRTQCVTGPCTVGDALHGYATINSVEVTVADYTVPSLAITGGTATTPGWKSGVVTLGYSATDNVGIGQVLVYGGGVSRARQDGNCNRTLPVPCTDLAGSLPIDTRVLSDGTQALVVVATDGAGNASSRSVQLNVDNQPPGPPLDLAVAGGSGWRQRNSFSVAWRNPAQTGRAPVAGAGYAICPATAPATVWTGCTFGALAKDDLTSLSGLTVPHAGEWTARVWLRDAAGNETSANAQSTTLRLDDSPPSVSFGPIDGSDPTRIDINASDSTSPLSGAEVEIRREGDARWLPVPAARSESGFVSHLDDEHLENGVYNLRARVFDSAGNERSTTTDTSGLTARRTLPARIETRLVAGQIKRVRARDSRGGKPRTRRIIVVRPTVDFGRTIPIRGRLTTPGANPIANAAIEVWEQLSVPGASSRRVALIGTDATGRFKFKALRGPSRILRFRYGGTPIVRARTTEVEIRVRATTTFSTSRPRVVNGDEITLRGRVLGGPLPTAGKLVQLQAYSRGRWLTFATPRANATTGRWSYRYRFTSTRGTVRYRFRVRVPKEAGFPYIAGASKLAHVVVRGL